MGEDSETDVGRILCEWICSSGEYLWKKNVREHLQSTIGCGMVGCGKDVTVGQIGQANC